MEKPNKALILIPVILVIFIGVVTFVRVEMTKNSRGTGVMPKACTKEAKLCSDGSAVVRTGPNCEFSLCPKEDLIVLDSPRAHSTIKSPLTVSGQARGTWFFEGDFPLVLTNWDGLIIAEGYATAQLGWMTEDFVPFVGTLEFETPEYKNNGSLILMKDNPSGLPEHDDALEVPVLFEVSEVSVE